jgi:hypothetical protein
MFTSAEARDEFEQHACTHGYEQPVFSAMNSCGACGHLCGDHEWREVGVGPCCYTGCECRAYAMASRS